MKKILLMISCCLFALTSCEIDNYESPNASIHGSIIDEKTGELVGMDVQDGGELKVVELGFANPQTQSWKIMNTGEYRNNLVFAATYDIRMENNNCYAFKQEGVVVKKGDNTLDFKVTPYIRIKNPRIEKNGNQIAFDEPIAIDPAKTYTLTIDVAANQSAFKYTGKNYFFRIGAKASIPDVGTIRYNYSPLVEIPF